jgi:hypothetical protein
MRHQTTLRRAISGVQKVFIRIDAAAVRLVLVFTADVQAPCESVAADR